jgi:hypothetical protein
MVKDLMNILLFGILVLKWTMSINIIKANNRVKLQVMIPYLDEYVEYGQEDLALGIIILYDKL